MRERLQERVHLLRSCVALTRRTGAGQFEASGRVVRDVVVAGQEVRVERPEGMDGVPCGGARPQLRNLVGQDLHLRAAELVHTDAPQHGEDPLLEGRAVVAEGARRVQGLLAGQDGPGLGAGQEGFGRLADSRELALRPHDGGALSDLGQHPRPPGAGFRHAAGPRPAHPLATSSPRHIGPVARASVRVGAGLDALQLVACHRRSFGFGVRGLGVPQGVPRPQCTDRNGLFKRYFRPEPLSSNPRVAGSSPAGGASRARVFGRCRCPGRGAAVGYVPSMSQERPSNSGPGRAPRVSRAPSGHVFRVARGAFGRRRRGRFGSALSPRPLHRPR